MRRRFQARIRCCGSWYASRQVLAFHAISAVMTFYFAMKIISCATSLGASILALKQAVIEVIIHPTQNEN